MRQPQARNCASSNSVISETINVAINMPMVTPGTGNAAEKAFPLFRRVFIGQQQRAAPFAADTHTLNNAQR